MSITCNYIKISNNKMLSTFREMCLATYSNYILIVSPQLRVCIISNILRQFVNVVKRENKLGKTFFKGCVASFSIV